MSMTLHRTVDVVKKAVLGVGIGIGALFLIVIIFQVLGVFKNIITPPSVKPPTTVYGILPPIQFPTGGISNTFTYTLNTITGGFPEFPDRLAVFPIVTAQPSLLNLERAKRMVASLGFDHSTIIGALPESYVGNATYEWDEQSGLQRKMRINIINFTFSLSSNYLTNPTVQSAQFLSDENNALETTRQMLLQMNSLPDDIDLSKTTNPDPDISYLTPPQPYIIDNGNLVSASSLSKAQLIRVNLYQKNINYQITTGALGNPHIIQSSTFSLPVMYSNPPYSAMNFWIGSGDSQPTVLAANFMHQTIASPSASEFVTYPIKPPQQAFNELKSASSSAYVASYRGSGNNVSINNVYLGYYMSDMQQQYLMPIYVFEGNNAFFGYVSAIDNRWIKPPSSPQAVPSGVLLK